MINRIADNPSNLQPLFDHARQLERELGALRDDNLKYLEACKEYRAKLTAAEKRIEYLLAVICKSVEMGSLTNILYTIALDTKKT